MPARVGILELTTFAAQLLPMMSRLMIPALVAAVMSACLPIQKKATIPVQKNLHDQSYHLNSTGPQLSSPSFSDIYVFKTEGIGVGMAIPPYKAFVDDLIFYSDSPKVIDEFVGMLGQGTVAWPGRNRGLTYHVVLKKVASSDALYLRVFIPSDAAGVAFSVGGMDPVMSLKNERLAAWVSGLQNGMVGYSQGGG